MTKHNILPSLLIAATATFVAAVPCFAQTQPDEPRTDVSSAPAISVVVSAVALNREIPARKRVEAVTLKAERPRLSAEMFEQSGDRFTNDSRFTTSNAFVYGPLPEVSKKQFQANNGSRSRVTFVPSGGPRAPWEQLPTR